LAPFSQLIPADHTNTSERGNQVFVFIIIITEQSGTSASRRRQLAEHVCDENQTAFIISKSRLVRRFITRIKAVFRIHYGAVCVR